MPFLKPAARRADSIRVERVIKEKEDPLEPSGDGIEKPTNKTNKSITSSNSSTTSSNDSSTTTMSTAKTAPSSAASSSRSSSGSSPSPSNKIKPATAERVAKTATEQPKTARKPRKNKNTNVLRSVRRSKKLIKAGSIPGLLPIASFGSIAATMRANIRPCPREESPDTETRPRQPSMEPE